MNPNANETKNNQETEIDLLEIFFLLLGHLPLIIFTALAFALLVNLGGELLTTPTYVSTSKLYVLPRTGGNADSVTSAELQSGLMLTQDYQQLVKTREIAQMVIAELDLRDATGEFVSADSILQKVSVSSESNTRVITIRVSDPDPYVAHDINESLLSIAANQIRTITTSEAVNVADKASMPTSPSGTGMSRRLMIGALIGAVLAAAGLILSNLLNDTIRTSEDIERYLGLSTLGQIPDTDLNGRGKRRKRRRRILWFGRRAHQ